MIQHKVENDNVAISFSVSNKIPHNLLGDPTRLRQILINLLNNALKFTQEGEITLAVHLNEKVKLAENEIMAEFIVKDTGIGISKEQQKTIFLAFNQADSSTTREYGGTGLGLSICKSLVEGMDGKIQVKSQLNQGCEFTFTVKFRKSSPSNKNGITPFKRENLNEKTILVIENDTVSQRILRFCCEDLGLNVIAISESIQSALQKMDELIQNKLCPDIILCALDSSEETNCEFLKKIRTNKTCRHVKIIAIKSNAQRGVAKKTEKTGFDAFLPKPVEPEQLLKILIALYNHAQDEGTIVTRHSAEELICQDIRILVVEDNSANQELIKSFFKILGCDGDYADNGQEAIDKLQKNTYDLCLMDIQMPVMGGLEATSIIRKKLNKNFPILALSAGVLPEDTKKCMEAGMNDFIRKPVTLEKIKDMILQYTRLKK